MRISALVSSIAVLTCVGVNAVAAAHDSALRGGNDVVDLADTVEVKPIHCQMKPWGPWGPCGIDGYKERHREVDVMPNDIGRACPFNTDRIKCRKQDCVVCDWKEGECDKETGKKRFWREIIRQSELDGEPCPSPADLERFDDCDVDCEAEDPLQYIEDDTCDANGDKWKYPKIKYDKKNNGADCPPRLPNGNCKQNCEYVPVPDNTGYGSCELEASSGKYYKTRPRVEAKPALYGGDPCLPDRIECTRQCYNSQPQKEFLSINSELNPSSQPTEAACCEYCKSLGNCKGYTYHAFFSGCYVVGSVDIIQGNIRAASSYVDFQ